MNELLQHSCSIFCDRHLEVSGSTCLPSSEAIELQYPRGGLQAECGPVGRQYHAVRCQNSKDNSAREVSQVSVPAVLMNSDVVLMDIVVKEQRAIAS